MAIKLEKINKHFGEKVVLKDFNLDLPDSGIVTLFGPSGSGKTTLMRILAGLQKPDSGNLTGLQNKRLSVVFQEDRLLPWLTACENVSIVLKASTQKEAQKEEQNESQNEAQDRTKEKPSISHDQVHQLFTRMGMEDAMGKYPHELSGGMKRRVALMRSLLYGGDVYLWDEAFKGLDIELKKQIMDDVKSKLKQSLIVLVTHDPFETEYLSDRIVNLQCKVKK